MESKCEQCGEGFVAENKRGPAPKWCSNACKCKAYRARNPKEKRVLAEDPVPTAMRRMRRWVRCDAQKRPTGPEGGLLMWSLPDVWMTRRQARVAEYGAGCGFVTGEGIGVIDLDDCISESGELSSLAKGILALNPGAYVERSQSGRGLHVFGRIAGSVCVRDAGLEVYAGDRKRFVWVTGDVFRAGGLPALSW